MAVFQAFVLLGEIVKENTVSASVLLFCLKLQNIPGYNCSNSCYINFRCLFTDFQSIAYIILNECSVQIILCKCRKPVILVLMSVIGTNSAKYSNFKVYSKTSWLTEH